MDSALSDKKLHSILDKLNPELRSTEEVDGEWTYNNFVGNRWNNVSAEDRRLYLKNTYRVLLTRARQGMTIFVPAGSDDDQTRKREWYDGIYGYLNRIGILSID